MKYTQNFNLKKPDGSDTVDVNDFNENADIIDEEIAKKATHLQDGRMSKEDKSKLDGIEDNANNYVHPASHPPSIIEQDAENRFFTDAERTKLSGIESGAQVNEVTGEEFNTLEQEFTAHQAKSVTRKVSNQKPTASDDETQGFKQGDVWIYENYVDEEDYEYETYICLDTKTGQAKWKKYVEEISTTAKIYGLEWNQTLDTYQRLDDAVGMDAITQGQNDFSNVYPWSEMKRCNLDDSGNVLAYFGDPTYKDDGSNGQVMVQIPKFWYKSEMVIEEGEKKYRWWIADAPVEGFKLHPAFIRNGVEKDVIYIGAYEGYVSGGKLHSIAAVMPTASKTIVEFRDIAQARGSKWFQQDFLTTCAIELLYLVEYAHFDSQTKIGQGITDDSVYHQTGETAQYGNQSYGDPNNATVAMSYRGIENFYGNFFNWVDGININDHRAYVADQNFESDKFDGHYRQVGFTNATSNGYVKDIGWTPQDDFMFLAIDSDGSDSSYLHDYYWQNSGALVARFGGYQSHRSNAGAFCWHFVNSSSDSGSSIGARLLCVP